MAEAREVRVKLTADTSEYIAAMKEAKRYARDLGWFDSRTRRVLVGYLWVSLIFMGVLLVATVGMGVWALATL